MCDPRMYKMDQIMSAHDPTVDTNGNQFLDEEDWRKRRALRDALDEATKNSGGLSTSRFASSIPKAAHARREEQARLGDIQRAQQLEKFEKDVVTLLGARAEQSTGSSALRPGERTTKDTASNTSSGSPAQPRAVDVLSRVVAESSRSLLPQFVADSSITDASVEENIAVFAHTYTPTTCTASKAASTNAVPTGTFAATTTDEVLTTVEYSNQQSGSEPMTKSTYVPPHLRGRATIKSPSPEPTTSSPEVRRSTSFSTALNVGAAAFVPTSTQAHYPASNYIKAEIQPAVYADQRRDYSTDTSNNVKNEVQTITSQSFKAGGTVEDLALQVVKIESQDAEQSSYIAPHLRKGPMFFKPASSKSVMVNCSTVEIVSSPIRSCLTPVKSASNGKDSSPVGNLSSGISTHAIQTSALEPKVCDKVLNASATMTKNPSQYPIIETGDAEADAFLAFMMDPSKKFEVKRSVDTKQTDAYQKPLVLEDVHVAAELISPAGPTLTDLSEWKKPPTKEVDPRAQAWQNARAEFKQSNGMGANEEAFTGFIKAKTIISTEGSAGRAEVTAPTLVTRSLVSSPSLKTKDDTAAPKDVTFVRSDSPLAADAQLTRPMSHLQKMLATKKPQTLLAAHTQQDTEKATTQTSADKPSHHFTPTQEAEFMPINSATENAILTHEPGSKPKFDTELPTRQSSAAFLDKIVFVADDEEDKKALGRLIFAQLKAARQSIPADVKAHTQAPNDITATGKLSSNIIADVEDAVTTLSFQDVNHKVNDDADVHLYKEGVRAKQGHPAAKELLDWDNNWSPPPAVWEDRGVFDTSFITPFIDEWLSQIELAYKPVVNSSENFKVLGVTSWKSEGYNQKLASSWDSGHAFLVAPQQPETFTNPKQTQEELQQKFKRTEELCLQYMERSKKALREEEKNVMMNAAHQEEILAREPEPNPWAPRIDMYMRPASTKDLQGIVNIYNHYINHTIIPEAQKPMTLRDMDYFLSSIKREGSPFLVAIKGKIPRQKRSGKSKARLPEFEPVIGFALCEHRAYSWSGPFNGRSRFSGNIHVYVDPARTRNGVGTVLLDRLLQTMTYAYSGKYEAGWVNPENDSNYENRESGPWYQAFIELPVLASTEVAKDLDYDRVKMFLSKFDMPEVYRTLHAGRSDSRQGPTKWLDVVTFQRGVTSAGDLGPFA